MFGVSLIRQFETLDELKRNLNKAIHTPKITLQTHVHHNILKDAVLKFPLMMIHLSQTLAMLSSVNHPHFSNNLAVFTSQTFAKIQTSWKTI